MDWSYIECVQKVGTKKIRKDSLVFLLAFFPISKSSEILYMKALQKVVNKECILMVFNSNLTDFH